MDTVQSRDVVSSSCESRQVHIILAKQTNIAYAEMLETDIPFGVGITERILHFLSSPVLCALSRLADTRPISL